MKMNLEKFLMFDSETVVTTEVLVSTVNNMNERQIFHAWRVYSKLRNLFFKKLVRRRNYTTLHRKHILKNRLFDSYIVRYFLIKACVDAMTEGVKAISSNGYAVKLNDAIENGKGYVEIKQIADIAAKSGCYSSVLDILHYMNDRYSMKQPEEIIYFLTNESYKVGKKEHDLLMEDIAQNLDILEIKPKSYDYIYRQVQLVGAGGDLVGDVDLAILSDSGQWYIIEAKTGKEKNVNNMRHYARKCLRHHHEYLSRKLGISTELVAVYRANGCKEFHWFQCEKPV